MTYFKAPSRFRLFLSKWGAAVFFVTSFVLVVSFPFALNRYLHWAIEDYASRVNGAEVTIREFDFSLLRGICRMEGVTVAHHTQVMRNLVELDEVTITFERLPLLAFKLIVPNVQVEGVHYGTTRERSGVLETDEYTELPSTALLDRIVPGAYDSVKASLGETPLRNLGQLTVGLAMHNSVAPHQQSLTIYQNIKSIDSQLDHLLSDWEKENDRITKAGLSAQERFNQLTALRQTVNRESANLADRASHSFDSLPQDTDFILNKLGIPSLASTDFSREVLGRRSLNHLERIAYWIDLSRRKMGLASQIGTATATRLAGSTPTINTSPRFWVRQVNVHSVAGSDPHKGNVTAEMRDLASSPLGEDHPLLIDLVAQFPGLQIQGLKLHAIVNHSLPEPKETIDFSLDSYPLVDWALEETPDLAFTIASGTMKLMFRSEFEGPKLKGKWTISLRDCSFKIGSRFALMERTLKEVLGPLASAIDVEASLEGTYGHESFEVQSAAGRDLAAALSQRFRTPLQNTKETIQEEIHDRLMPQQKRLENRIANATTHLDRRLADALEAMGLPTR
jgi:uncharacterized protein (TIGR03545 family)